MTPPIDACGPPQETGAVCDLAFRLTHNSDVARISDVVIARPAKILLILVVAWTAVHLLRRAVRRFTHGLGTVIEDVLSGERTAGTLLRTASRTTARARLRAETIGALLGSVVNAVVWTIATMMILGELGLNLGPLVAGAGIAGVALGFGAQNLVRDFLSGIFMLIEEFGWATSSTPAPPAGRSKG